jgi:membrane protein
VDRDQAETLAKAHDAPETDDPRKPAHLWQLSPRSWWYALRRAVHNFLVNIDTDVAGTLTYFAVVSMFPGLLALLTLLSLFGQGEATAAWIIQFLARHVDAGVVDLLRDPVLRLTHAPSAGWVLLASLALALWGAAGYVGAFGRALNRVYDVAEGRPFWVTIPYNLALTALTLLVGTIGMLAILLSTTVVRQLGDYVGLAEETVRFWSLARWPILVFAALAYVAALYFATPNVRLRFRLVTPGTIVALAGALAATYGFNTFVTNWGTWNETYGIVGSVIVLLLGLWLTNCVLLFGGELDAELERVRELQGGFAAEVSIQLRPRDDRIIREVIAADDRFVAQGRALRERYAGPTGHPADAPGGTATRSVRRGRARRPSDG